MRVRRPSRGVVLAALLVAGLLVPEGAQAEGSGDDASPGPDYSAYSAQAFDAAVLRPLGLTAVIVGSALFVPAAIVSAPGGRDSLQHAWEVFVQVPGAFVFKRPLGEF